MATENKRVEVEEMEENKNIVPVKAEIVKEKKKKHPVRNIIIAIVAVFFLSALVFGGDDSDSTPASNTKETQQEAQAGDTEEVETVEEEKAVPEPEKGESQVEDQPEKSTQNTGYEIDGAIGNSKYVHVGDTRKLINNGSMTILDAWYDGYEHHTLFVLVEFTGGDEPLRLTYNDATLYVDDYEFPLNLGVDEAASYGTIIANDKGATYPTFVDIVATGRKGQMVFLATFPENLSESSDVEFDITGAIFKVNPLSAIHADDEAKLAAAEEEAAKQAKAEASTSSLGIYYGTYTCQYNTVGGYNEAFIGFTTDEDGGDYIMIDCHDAEDTGMPDNFSGAVGGYIGETEDGDGAYYSIVDYEGTEVFRLLSVYNGFSLEAIDPNYREGISSFDGIYVLSEKLGNR